MSGFDIVQMLANERDARLKSAAQYAVQQDPDKYAEAQRLGKALGQSPEKVSLNLDESRRVVNEEALRQVTFRRRHPRVARLMEGMQFMTLAQDDQGNTLNTEGDWDWIGRSWDAARLMSQRGTIGRDAMREGRGFTRREQLQLQRADNVMRVRAERDDGIFSSAINLIGSTVDSAGAAIAAHVATGNTPVLSQAAAGAAAFSQSFRIEAGNLYADLIEQGYTPAQAAPIARRFGAGVAAIDIVGLGAAAQPFKIAGREALKKLTRKGVTDQARESIFKEAAKAYITGVIGESSTEAVQEVVQMLGEEEARRRFKPTDLSTFDLGRAGDAFVETFKGMLVVGAIGSGSGAMMDTRRAANAEHQARAMLRAATREAESTLGKRSMETRAEFVGELAQANNTDNVYVEGSKVLETLAEIESEQEGSSGKETELVDSILPKLREQAEQAALNGGNVRIPSGDFFSKLVDKTELGKRLMDRHATFDPDEAMTGEEAKQFDRKQALEDYQAAAQFAEEEAAQAQASADEVQSLIEGQLREVNGGKATWIDPNGNRVDARAQASFLRDFFVTQAAELGLSPKEFYDRYAVVIESASGDQRGGFVAEGRDGRPTIRLYEKQDASTFLHETPHFFLHVYGDLARSGEATARMREDMDSLIRWFGLESVDQWNGMSIDEQRVYHERFAVSYEKHLADGKSPSTALGRLYAKFGRWLRSVYKTITEDLDREHFKEFGEHLPILTPEVRMVMDRMVASEQQVEQAYAIREGAAAFKTADEAGMSPEEWDAYVSDLQLAKDTAVNEMTRRSLTGAGWLLRARGRARTAVNKEAREARESIKSDVIDEVDRSPVMRARHFLRKGELRDENLAEVEVEEGSKHKMDAEMTRALLPEGATLNEVRGMTMKNGLSPDQVAQMFGFESGAQMVDVMMLTPSRSELIESQTDARLLEEKSELATPEALDAAIEVAYHNEIQGRIIRTELNSAAKLAGTSREQIAAAKEAARDQLSGMKVGEIRPRDFSYAEGRARKRAQKALAEGDTETFVLEKRNELLQFHLALESAKVIQERNSSVTKMQRVFGPDEKMAKTRDLNLVKAGRALVSMIGLQRGPKVGQPMAHMESVKDYDPEAYERITPMVADVVQTLQDVDNPRDLDWRGLTLDEFRMVEESVESLYNLSRRVKQIELDGKRVTREEMAAQLRDAAVEQGGVRVPDIDEPAGMFGGFFDWLKSYAANATRVEFAFRALDGGRDNGPWTQMFRKAKDAGNNYREELRERAEVYEKLVRDHDWGPNVKIDASEKLGIVFESKAQLLGLLRHIGNASNERKALLGASANRPNHQWAKPIKGSREIDASVFYEWMQELVNDGTLTESDFDLLQSIWDFYEEQKPALFKAHYENFGYTPKDVPARAFTVTFPDGTTKKYRGGYVPARAQSKGNIAATARDISTSKDFMDSYAAVPRGMTKARNERFATELDYDLSTGQLDLAETLRFIHMQKPVNEIKSLMYHPEVERVIAAKNPHYHEQVILPWLKRTALQQSAEQIDNPALALVGRIASNANLAVMFGNVGNSLQNYTGLVEALTRAKKKHVLAAIASYIASPSKARKSAVSMSKELANRQGRQMFEIRQRTQREIVNPSNLSKAKDWFRQNGYFLQSLTQNQVDVIVWTAAYNQALETGVDPAEAIQQGDAAIRQTQMATDPEDVSSWESGNSFVRALFPFQSWFIRWANNQGVNFQTAPTVGARLSLMLYGYALPLVLAQLVSELVNGRLEDEDDDGYADDLGSMALKSMVSGTLQAAPVLGKPTEAFLNMWLDDEVWNDRMPSPPFIRALERAQFAVQDVVQGDADIRDAEDIVTFFGNLTGLPIGSIMSRYRYAHQAAEGRLRNPVDEALLPAGLEYARGLLTGR